MNNNQILISCDRKILKNWGNILNLPIKKDERIEKYRKRLLSKLKRSDIRK